MERELFAEKFINKHVRVAKKEIDREGNEKMFFIDGILEEISINGFVLNGEKQRIITWDAVTDITLIE